MVASGPPWLASLLALLASLSWGTADFWAGLESRKTTAWTAALIGQGVAALALVAVLLVLAPKTPSAAALVPAVLGGVAGAAGALLQYRALALLDMSIASPIVAGAALIPVLWGLARGEQPGAGADRRRRDDPGRDRGDLARAVTR